MVFLLQLITLACTRVGAGYIVGRIYIYIHTHTHVNLVHVGEATYNGIVNAIKQEKEEKG